jgi:hypothetical protein
MVATPKAATLKRYGLSIEEWRTILANQGGVCAVCKRLPSTGRLCVDREHVKGWKKMTPEQRKLYVRGLVCWLDNHRVLTRGVTAERLHNGAVYLDAYQARRAVQ